MSLLLNQLTARNFLSVGNSTQGINLNRQDLTLVLGENLDAGGDGSRNGVGKTALVNILSYALYGQAISNIRKDNLINLTNAKNMLVSVDFSISGQAYRIERGRKPNILKFYVNDQEQQFSDQAQGDSRETQSAIDNLLGISHEMFKHIVAINTYTDPFLSLKTNDQRAIIEQLLGITQLSERAEKIKVLTKATRDAITQEEFRIRAINEANTRIHEQIDSLKRKQKLWLNKKEQDITIFAQSIDDLSHVDGDTEIQQHKDLEIWNAKSASIAEATRWTKTIETEQKRLEKTQSKLKQEIESLELHKCHACGQELHDEKQNEIIQSKKEQLQEAALHWLSNNTQYNEHQAAITEIGDIGHQPKVFYDSLEQALNHRHTVETLHQQLAQRTADEDPYEEQIHEMVNQAIQEVSYDALNELTRLQEHQDFLMKLLTSKDSFIRKKIIDQNLAYLNSRLTYYLDRVGLPHSVKFLNDLSVSIEEFGRELDFGNLSRGEMTRLTLSLSFAFRDVHESLFGSINLLFIDEMIDSGLDSAGVESALSLLKKMSRDRQKSVWLVSHREELISRVDNKLIVQKQDGFTSFMTEAGSL
jgi:DNA repair exonuclease SbcCD ATPase subunit